MWHRPFVQTFLVSADSSLSAVSQIVVKKSMSYIHKHKTRYIDKARNALTPVRFSDYVTADCSIVPNCAAGALLRYASAPHARTEEHSQVTGCTNYGRVIAFGTRAFTLHF